MNAIFAKLLYEMEKDHDTVLVTVIASSGSAPSGTGAMMLVGESGRLVGTIGGGAVEMRSEERALELLREQESFCVRDFPLREWDKEGIGMACGGDVRVLLQRIPGTDAAWNALAGAVVDRINGKQPGYLVQYLDGRIAALEHEAVAAEGPVAVSQPLPIGERVIIFGGGHCAQALAPLLTMVGFRVTVMDSRPEYAARELFPQAEEIICGDYDHLDHYLTILPEDYLVIMTNGHSHDFEVQEQVLRYPAAYVGVIGSRSKTAAVNRKLREKGVPEEGICRVHTPIGTAIKAVTPAEIAVSIAGEMIYERALRRESAGIVARGCPMH